MILPMNAFHGFDRRIRHGLNTFTISQTFALLIEGDYQGRVSQLSWLQ
jgi:hypothetical protein